MKSLGVLVKEMELMDYIISIKKGRNEDYDDFDFKKNMIDVEIKVRLVNR